MNRARLTALLLAAAALAGVGLLAIAALTPTETPSAHAVCRALDDLTDAMDLDTWTDQAALRARAARVARMVSARAEARGSQDRAAVADGIIAVLEDPTSTLADLERALAPVVRGCGPPPRGG